MIYQYVFITWNGKIKGAKQINKKKYAYNSQIESTQTEKLIECEQLNERVKSIDNEWKTWRERKRKKKKENVKSVFNHVHDIEFQ